MIVRPARERITYPSGYQLQEQAMVAALYLSRFEHEALGLGNQDQTFAALANRLKIKKNTLKNYRDYFDPHTGSHRRGWWQAPLPHQLENVLKKFGSASEEALRTAVLSSISK